MALTALGIGGALLLIFWWLLARFALHLQLTRIRRPLRSLGKERVDELLAKRHASGRGDKDPPDVAAMIREVEQAALQSNQRMIWIARVASVLPWIIGVAAAIWIWR